MKFLAALSTGVVLVLLASQARAWPGTWLVIEDPLEPALAVVVLGGQIPIRAGQAAAIYAQGLAREVWLTEGAAYEREPAPVLPKGTRMPELGYGGQRLLAMGVPKSVIRILPGRTVNTADEVRAVNRQLASVGGGRVILVTSKYHSRRVRVLWRTLASSRFEAIVRHAPDDSIDPSQWWRSQSGVHTVSREWLGLAQAWVR